jgi:chromosome partitioning protein
MVEMAVRKLLVASQKGGVGKTTTSVNLAAAAAAAGARVLLLSADPLSGIGAAFNLAQHPRRRPLRQAGLDLPGVVVADVVPGVDVLGPYDDGGCSDEELDELLRLTAAPSLGERYGCLIVDAPPFLGGKPTQLAATCDDLVLVMRAEPLAHRTLPAFLELVQRSRRPGGKAVTLRGVLLTLPEGEPPGGRWERELRGRLGTRVLPQVIPFDEEVGKALLLGEVVCRAAPESPASAEYHHLAESLGLAAEAGQPEDGDPLPALTEALRARPRALVGAAAPARPASEAAESATEEPPLDELTAPAPLPARLVSAVELPVLSHLPPLPPTPRPPKRPRPEPRPESRPEPASAPKAAPPPGGVNSKSPLLVGVGLAVVMGVGLKLLQVPPYLVHLAVGCAVAGLAFLLLRALEADAAEDGPRRARERGGRKPGEPRKSGRSGPESRKTADARLAALSRRSARREPNR